MVNYRIFNAVEFTSGSSGTIDRVWGVMKATPICSGTVTLEAYSTSDTSLTGSRSTLKLEYLAQGQPIPAYIRNISVTSGSAYLLA